MDEKTARILPQVSANLAAQGYAVKVDAPHAVTSYKKVGSKRWSQVFCASVAGMLGADVYALVVEKGDRLVVVDVTVNQDIYIG